MKDSFICPVCQTSLEVGEHVWVCANNHSFDVAKPGYVNLVLQRGKAKEIMGDTLAMLKKRRSFLERGYYEPLVEVLVGLVAKYSTAQATVLDVGCGEGYYLGQLYKAEPERNYCGLDISKDAIQLAAKKYTDVQFVVADVNTLLPLADSSLDVLLNIFAPRNATEFVRVVKDGGVVVVVIPGQSHLAELRQKYELLEIEENKAEKVKAKLAELSFVENISVKRVVELPAEAVKGLIEMTPNAWFATEGERVYQDASVTIDFEILIFQK